MDFNSIKGSIQDTWEFAWPPILLLTLLLGILAHVAPTQFASLRNRSATLLDPLRAKRVRGYLRLWGLGKLIPILAAVAAIFALYVTNQIVRTVGDVIPPRISFRPGSLVLNRADPRLLFFLVRPNLGPEGKDTSPTQTPLIARPVRLPEPSEAAELAEREIRRLSQDDPDTRQWLEETGKMARRFGTTKFLLVWLLGCAILEKARRSRLRVRRFAAWAIFLAIVAAGYAISYLYAVDQTHLAEIGAVQARLNREYVGVVRDPRYDYFLRQTELHRRDERWWSLGTGKTEDLLKWLYRQVLRGGA